MGEMHAVAIRVEVHVPGSRSLKEKRAVIRPVIDGLRHRFRCSVAETGFQDQWQRAELAVALVAASAAHLQEQVDAVERFVHAAPDLEVCALEHVPLDGEGVLAP